MSYGLSYEEMKEILQSRLKPKRFRHSLGVSDTAVFLAQRFGVDVEKARIAGLLHDCAREFPNDDMIAEAEKRHIAIGPIERAMPLLLHAYIGAIRIKEIYQVDDAEISQAIWRHTVAGAKMSDLDKIIWYADMVEPNRGEYPGVDELRHLAKHASLDEMFLAGLAHSIAFVAQKGTLIHPDTITAYNEVLLKKMAKEG